MKKSNADAIRPLLREHPDGLTTTQLATLMAKLDPPIRTTDPNVRTSLKAMPDVYIDRWVPANASVWAAVWCSVVPPDHCPKPEGPPQQRKKPRKCQPKPNTHPQ